MYKCKLCNKEFKNYWSLAAHVAYHQKTACKICGRIMAPCNMGKHLRWHRNDGQCLFCQKPVSGGKKFCNTSCAAYFNNQKKERKTHPCAGCGEKIYRGKYCSRQCQFEVQYQKFIDGWIEGKISGNTRTSGDISHHVRRWLFNRAGGKCEVCGWAKKNPYTDKIPLTVHHKDGDYRNTNPKNIELICPCCHSLTPTYGALNRCNNGRKKISRRKEWRP